MLKKNRDRLEQNGGGPRSCPYCGQTHPLGFCGVTGKKYGPINQNEIESTSENGAPAAPEQDTEIIGLQALMVFLVVICIPLGISSFIKSNTSLPTLIPTPRQVTTSTQNSAPTIFPTTILSPAPATVIAPTKTHNTPTFAPTSTTKPVIRAEIPYDLALVSDRSGYLSVYVMEQSSPDSKNALNLPTAFEETRWPTFCGDQVAAEAIDRNGSLSSWIFFYDLDKGSSIRWVPSVSIGTPPLHVPRCSFDGRWMVFTIDHGDQLSLSVVDLSNGSEVSTINVEETQALHNSYAAWGGMGNTTLWWSATKHNTNWWDGNWKIYEVTNILDSNSSTEKMFDGKFPAVSPDGSFLAYVCDGYKKLCIVNLSSGLTIYTRQIITKAINGEYLPVGTPVFSVDNQWVYFSSAEDGDWDIYRMHLNGSNLENLTDSWQSADGQKSNEIMPAVRASP